MRTDTRRHRRSPVELVGTLELMDQGGRGPAFGATIRNVAAGGVGLSLGSAIPVGARVRLSVKGEVLVGVVVHCERVSGEFSAGIAVEHAAGALSRIGWIASLRPSAHQLPDRLDTGSHLV